MNTVTKAELELHQMAILDGVKSNTKIDSNHVVMANQMPSGSQEVLARYGDDIWKLPRAICANGMSPYKRKISFSKLDNDCFTVPLKVAMASYYLKGIPGSSRPRGSTIYYTFQCLIFFLNYLSSIGLNRTKDITPEICAHYVTYCKAYIGRNNKSPSPSTLINRFSAVRTMYSLLKETEHAFGEPWPDTTVSTLSKYRTPLVPKTKIIPDEVSRMIMQKSVEWLYKGDQIIVRMERFNNKKKKRSLNLKPSSQNCDSSLKHELRCLENACMIIILMTTGIRVHELLSIERDAIYTTIDDQGDRLLWLRGISEKTKEGKTEWLCPELCHNAVRVAERIARPLQEKLKQSLNNEKDEAIRVRLGDIQNRLFLRNGGTKASHITAVSAVNVYDRLKYYVRKIGTDWNFTPHQCRRTFAVYVARHILGDLRYLREHYKHWSIDMTALYASNESQDRELYDEIHISMANEKLVMVEHWLDASTPIAGGLGERIKVFRKKEDNVRTYASTSEMIKKVSDTISLRATGTAWCTADLSGCNGGNGPERTKCGDCPDSIIDSRKQPLWEAIYMQQLELTKLNDIGEQGKIVAHRALKHCERVLIDLGADINKLQKDPL